VLMFSHRKFKLNLVARSSGDLAAGMQEKGIKSASAGETEPSVVLSGLNGSTRED